MDLDDGGTRWEFIENVCIANGTAGLKLGHDVDQITFTNNIVVVTPPLWAQRERHRAKAARFVMLKRSS